MVNTRSGNVCQKEDQDASVMARMIAPTERGPQPQKDTTGNQEANSRLSITAENLIRDMVDQNLEQIRKIIDEKTGLILSRVTKPCSFKTFLSCQPPEFSVSPDPTAILHRITEMEQIFDLCECKEEQKVKFAVRMLKGEALSWWNMTWMLLGKEIVSRLTWDEFVERVKEWYCSAWDLIKMQNEFLTLKKGDMTVDEYARLFVAKLQYVRHLAPSDKDCVERFVAGLPFKYSMAVRRETTLDSAIRVAKSLDVDKYEEREDVGEKRKWVGTLGSLKKSKGDVKCCYQCGKAGHLARQCRENVVTCFECGENGHISNSCPNRERD